MSAVDKLQRWLKPTNRVMVAVLLVILVLNLYRPRSVTRYGQRKQDGPRGALTGDAACSTTSSLRATDVTATLSRFFQDFAYDVR